MSDELFRVMLASAVEKLRGASDLTMIYTSHNMREIEIMCNRIGILHFGYDYRLAGVKRQLHHTRSENLAQLPGDLLVYWRGLIEPEEIFFSELAKIPKLAQPGEQNFISRLAT